LNTRALLALIYTFVSLLVTGQATATFRLDMRTPLKDGWLNTPEAKVGIRGDVPPLSWSETYFVEDADGDGYYTGQIVFDLEEEESRLAFKIKVEDANLADEGWQKGRNHHYLLRKGEENLIEIAWEDMPKPLPLTTTGNVVVWKDFDASPLQSRPIWIYLPPDYEESDDRYPVLYMHDGQNVFDVAAAGQEWQMDEAAEKLIHSGAISPLIIVGVGNTSERMDEYTPSRSKWRKELKRCAPAEWGASAWNAYTGIYSYNNTDSLKVRYGKDEILEVTIPGSRQWQKLENLSEHLFYLASAGIYFDFEEPFEGESAGLLAYKEPVGGKGSTYAQWLTEGLKPYIDRNLRTIIDESYLGGSSLGGLITMQMALEYPNVYKKFLVVSPSVWWDDRVILESVKASSPNGQKIWISAGTGEGDDMIDGARALHTQLLEVGWHQKDILYHEIENAQHSERDWARLSEDMLLFLVGKH
jgi:predicted alpha/beta superfamily hydrolase